MGLCRNSRHDPFFCVYNGVCIYKSLEYNMLAQYYSWRQWLINVKLQNGLNCIVKWPIL